MKAIIIGSGGMEHRRLLNKTGCRKIELRPYRNTRSGCFIRTGHEDSRRAKNGCLHILKLLQSEMKTSLSDVKIKYGGEVPTGEILPASSSSENEDSERDIGSESDSKNLRCWRLDLPSLRSIDVQREYLVALFDVNQVSTFCLQAFLIHISNCYWEERDEEEKTLKKNGVSNNGIASVWE